MKITKWFRTGEPAPDDATYIKSEYKVVAWEEVHPLLGSDPVYEEFHLYEVPIPPDASAPSVK